MDTNYNGYDLNNGRNDQEILYLGSCQSFCESKYRATTHYTYITSSFSNIEAQNECWCKSSNAGAYAIASMIAGDTSCAGNKSDM